MKTKWTKEPPDAEWCWIKYRLGRRTVKYPASVTNLDQACVVKSAGGSVFINRDRFMNFDDFGDNSLRFGPIIPVPE